jgi:hypothetical protein
VHLEGGFLSERNRGERGGPRRARRGTAQGVRLPTARGRKEKKGELLPRLRFCPPGQDSVCGSSSPQKPLVGELDRCAVPQDPSFEISALRFFPAVRDPGPTAFLLALRGPPRSPRSSALSAISFREGLGPHDAPRTATDPPTPHKNPIQSSMSIPRILVRRDCRSQPGHPGANQGEPSQPER